MTSTIKVDNIQDQDGNNIINENANTITIGASGDTVTLASGASQSGFGRSGTVDWDTTPKTSNFTAVNGDGFFVNTTSSAITVTLPAGSAGSIVSLKDYANTWDTNNVTLTPNGTDKINGTNASATLNTEDQSVTLVYVDSTKGWRVVQDSTSSVDGAQFVAATGGTVTTCGDFKIHTFTGPGCFTVSNAGNAAGNNQLEYIVVAGGGGAGYDTGGGGGGGGFRFASPSLAPATYPGKPLAGSTLTAAAQTYPITVGGGGTSSSSTPTKGTTGSNSIFSTITSQGGGGGGSSATPATRPGRPGGSGGGGSNPNGSGGSGNAPPVSPSQGNDGGDNQIDNTASGGGGGAIAAGSDTQPNDTGGNAGDGAGIPTAFGSNGEPCGSFRYYAGGGGGGGRSPAYGPAGSGGKGGGGDGVITGPGNAGTANTGGGAGGPSASTVATAGNGGSGIVIIRYKFQN